MSCDKMSATKCLRQKVCEKVSYNMYITAMEAIYHLQKCLYTRSQARKIVDHLSSAPYPTAVLARAKIKAPVAVAKFEQLLKQETTPPPEELLDAVLQINVESNPIPNQENGMHIIGDILYEVTSTFRKWMTAKGYEYANTSAFFNRWKQNGGSTGYSNDTTLEAVRLREFVDETENQSENAKTQRYLQIKAWMRMYHQRCTLVHKFS